MSPRNVILTGVPRSGTTLACHLLNRLDDTVALHEPMRVEGFRALGSHEAIVAHIAEFFAETRRSLLERGTAFSKHAGGEIPDDPFTRTPGADGLRASMVRHGEIRIHKPLSDEFCLVLKHPAAFTALLPTLSQTFLCFALVRNPLAVLRSWNSLPVNFRSGHAPSAERLDENLRRRLATFDDPIERQLRLLDWYCTQFLRNLPRSAILRYEDVIATHGAALSVMQPSMLHSRVALENRNVPAEPLGTAVEELAERLLASCGSYWEFYSREDVERLLYASAPCSAEVI